MSMRNGKDTALPKQLRIAFFAGYANDMAVTRRLLALGEAGADVHLFAFDRARYDIGVQPTWCVTSLGAMQDGKYLTRAYKFLTALLRITRHRNDLRRSSIFYARNLDMALIAILSRKLFRCKALLIYEVLDVLDAVSTPRSMTSRLLRGLERLVLSRCACLVVSSTAYVDHYFGPLQRYRGPWALIENKLTLPQLNASARPLLSDRLLTQSPATWVIGWFGTLRDRRSLLVLADLARLLEGGVHIELYGVTNTIGSRVLSDTLRSAAHVAYRGTYDGSKDLPSLYRGVHLMWCADLQPTRRNDRWCLPNRLYEAAFFGVPLIALQGTETGRYVEERGLGWALPAADVASVAAFLKQLKFAEYNRVVQNILSQDEGLYAGDDQVVTLVTAWRDAPTESRGGAANTGTQESKKKPGAGILSNRGVWQRLPNFIYIGPNKAGSTWLYEALRNHPQAFTTEAKELHYFDLYYELGKNWYLRQFSGVEERHRVVCDISHDYLYSLDACKRIRSDLGDVRLMVCLRDPVQRSFSQYLYFLKDGVAPISFRQALEKFPNLIEHSLYAKHLLPYKDLFGKASLVITLFDDLKSDGQLFFDSLCERLGIEKMELPASARGVVLPAAAPRSRVVARIAKRGANLLRKMGFPSSITRVKSNKIVQDVLYTEYPAGQRPTIEPDIREMLMRKFRSDIGLLEQEFGVAVPSQWGYR